MAWHVLLVTHGMDELLFVDLYNFGEPYLRFFSIFFPKVKKKQLNVF